MPLDLVDAVIFQLKSVQQVTAAFGDTWNQQAQSGVAKFFNGVADQVPSPYCVITEAGETYDYMMRVAGNEVSFTSPGNLIFSVFASSAVLARNLGFLCGKALNDYPLQWPGDEAMSFRVANSRLNPVTDIGAGQATVFNRVFTFAYEWQGVM